MGKKFSKTLGPLQTHTFIQQLPHRHCFGINKFKNFRKLNRSPHIIKLCFVCISFFKLNKELYHKIEETSQVYNRKLL